MACTTNPVINYDTAGRLDIILAETHSWEIRFTVSADKPAIFDGATVTMVIYPNSVEGDNLAEISGQVVSGRELLISRNVTQASILNDGDYLYHIRIDYLATGKSLPFASGKLKVKNLPRRP